MASLSSWLFGSPPPEGRGDSDEKKKDKARRLSLRKISILVIDSGKQSSDWKAVFNGIEFKERALQVVQCAWDEFHIMSDGPYSRTPCIISVLVEVEPHKPKRVVSLKPDFVLVRNEVRSLDQDYRNKLYGLMYANIPSVNSLSSIYMCLERPIVQGQLNKLASLHGDKFRLVPQSYFASHRDFFYGNTFPAVVKVGSAHAGYGKMKVHNHKDMEDFKSVLAVAGKYCTAEPFIEGKFDLRIQKIGANYRAFKRVSVSGTWKTNTQTSHTEEIEMTDEYKFWADEAAKLFGGLDIVSVDAIHNSKDGKEYIMEINGTSSGLMPECTEQDNIHIRDVVLKKLEEVHSIV